MRQSKHAHLSGKALRCRMLVPSGKLKRKGEGHELNQPVHTPREVWSKRDVSNITGCEFSGEQIRLSWF
jgi:hypothetical protein